jgi:hypothetical protein
MPENGQNEKKRKSIPFQNGSKLLIQIRIGKHRKSMSTKAKSVFKDPDVAEILITRHGKYVVVPAD